MNIQSKNKIMEKERKDKSPEEKVEELKEAIAKLGFKIEVTDEGEIRIKE